MDSGIPGLRVLDLITHEDERGSFTELFRKTWTSDLDAVQWNCVHSRATVLRGVHVHVNHADFLTVVRGSAQIGLRDLRPGHGNNACLVPLSAAQPRAILIPPGVAHGFYFEADSLHIYAVSEYWDSADELGCRWDDPDLKIDWPCTHPIVSARDAELPSLTSLTANLSGRL